MTTHPQDVGRDAGEGIACALDDLTRALDRNFTSPNVLDANAEPANVVDGLYLIACALRRIAEAMEARGDQDPGPEERILR